MTLTLSRPGARRYPRPSADLLICPMWSHQVGRGAKWVVPREQADERASEGFARWANGPHQWAGPPRRCGTAKRCRAVGLIGGVPGMATTRQKQAARQNLKRAREVQSARAHGEQLPRTGQGLSTAEDNRLADADFAFPKERKEPLTDTRHVRNAVARFDQVEGVSDAERDRAWKQVLAMAKKFDVEVAEDDWRELFEGGKANKR